MDRREMIHSLSQAMAGNLESLRSTGQVEYGRNSVKSYILEVNSPESGDAFTPANALATLPKKIGLTLIPTDDSTLFQLDAKKGASSETHFYLDTLDQRYWLLHTLSPANEADLVIRDLVLRSMRIDSAWMPTRQLQEWLNDLGTLRAMTARFAAPAGIHNDSLSLPGMEDEGFVLKLMGTKDVRSRWSAAVEVDALGSHMALWSANIARTDGDLLVRADLTSDGKATARGNSFLLHQEVIGTVKNYYRALIAEFEERFRVGWLKSGTGLLPTGHPAEIHFPSGLSPVSYENLLISLFDCGAPFRLYGTPIWQGGDRFVSQSVDLHTGHSLKLEMTPRLIRVYLSPGSCGNVLARLLTNLQRYYDARAELL